MTEKIALFDLDGTLADYEGSMKRNLKRLASPNEVTYNTHDREAPAWFKKRKDLICSKPGWWAELGRFGLGFDILNEAIMAGFEIHVLTKGPMKPDTAWTEKLQWCKEHLPSAANITITRDKSLVYGLLLVDDYPPFLEGWLEHRPRGYCIMPANDNNKDFTHPRVVRYDGTPAAMNKVKEILLGVFSREPGQPIA